MKQKLVDRAIFISKSLLWSVLFFFATMAILNWEEFFPAGGSGSPKSWVIKEYGKDKELIPVKAGGEGKVSPVIQIIRSINECF